MTYTVEANTATNAEADAKADAERRSIQIAAARLAREAQQVLSFGRRGVEDITEKFLAASKGSANDHLIELSSSC
jgi:hypothetical protein